MKNVFNYFILSGFILLVASCKKEETEDPIKTIVDFEDLILETDTFWNGSEGNGTFTSSSVAFQNTYNAQYNFWSGFAYSTKTDKETAGFSNQYSVYGTSGANNSKTFILFNGSREEKMIFAETEKIGGMYLTNGTYAYQSMQNGDDFARKFTPKDWFKVWVKAYDENNLVTDSVAFFLAQNGTIVDEWIWLDLSSLGKVKSISFRFDSSDKGEYGINTPQYIFIDDITILN